MGQRRTFTRASTAKPPPPARGHLRSQARSRSARPLGFPFCNSRSHLWGPLLRNIDQDREAVLRKLEAQNRVPLGSEAGSKAIAGEIGRVCRIRRAMLDYRRHDCRSPLGIEVKIDHLSVLQVYFQVHRLVGAIGNVDPCDQRFHLSIPSVRSNERFICASAMPSVATLRRRCFREYLRPKPMNFPGHTTPSKE